MKKRYNAYVASNVGDYFEQKIKEYGGTIIERIHIKVENNEPCYNYIIEMEEGIIDPIHEIKD